MEQSVYTLSGAILVFGLSLIFGAIHGFRNGPLVMASVISTRAVSPGRAFMLCAISEFAGVFIFGTAVVTLISQNLYGGMIYESRPEVILVLACGLGAAILWGLFCHWRALPTSNNHALFAGLSGAGWAAWGTGYLMNSTLLKIFLVLILTPLAALVLSTGLTWVIRYLGEWMTPKVVWAADRIHIGAAMLMSAVDGSNEGQIVLSLAVIALAIMDAGGSPAFSSVVVPLWLKLAVATSIAAGVLMEGHRIVKKLGMSFYRLEISQGTGSQLSAAGLVFACLMSGFPASPAHVVTGSILGAGVAKNPRAVRWGVAAEIVLSWAITIPASLFLAFSMVKVAKYLGAG